MTPNPEIKATPILTPTEIRKGIRHYADLDQEWIIPWGAKGVITGSIIRVLKTIGITDREELVAARRLIIGYLTLPGSAKLATRSSKKLSDGEWIGFSRWHSERLPSGQYQERRTYASEVIQVLYRARHDLQVANGQLPLFGLLAYWEDLDAHDPGVFELDEFQEKAREIAGGLEALLQKG